MRSSLEDKSSGEHLERAALLCGHVRAFLRGRPSVRLEKGGVALPCKEGLALSKGSPGRRREMEVGPGDCASLAGKL